MKRVLISGGWGYRNFGDDAILLSTIKLLNEVCYDDLDVTVITYSKKETSKILSKDTHVLNSFQRKIFQKNFEYEFYFSQSKCLFEKPFAFYKKAFQWYQYKKSVVFFKFGLKYPKTIFFIIQLLCPKLVLNIKKTNLLILSGGGYLNSWRESLLTKYLEVLIARKYNKKIISIGQSIGPFNCELYELFAKEVLSECKTICVRDSKSLQLVLSLINDKTKVVNQIMPDLAFYDVKKPNTDLNSKLVFIVGYDNIENIKSTVCEALLKVQKDFDIEIVFTVSQLWTTIKSATELYEYCNSMGLKSKIVIPKDFVELENMLSKSTLVCSQNLHGLILANRNGVNVISLNDRRKFISFMKMINREEFILPIIDFDIDDFYALVQKSLKSKSDYQLNIEISDTVKRLFTIALGDF